LGEATGKRFKRFKRRTLSVLPHALQEVQPGLQDDDVECDNRAFEDSNIEHIDNRSSKKNSHTKAFAN
jgi:hypothetical protein